MISSSSLSLEFKDADLVGVLETILAHTGYTMIFKGSSTTVSLTLPNVSPLAAIDYVLRMVDMTYIKHDNIIYVGTASTLNASFVDKQALTKFSLKYISTDTLMSQLSTLGVSVTLVKMEDNNREFWVTGTPMQLAKLKDLAKTLDIKKHTTLGSAAISSSLTPIELKYLATSNFPLRPVLTTGIEYVSTSYWFFLSIAENWTLILEQSGTTKYPLLSISIFTPLSVFKVTFGLNIDILHNYVDQYKHCYKLPQKKIN